MNSITLYIAETQQPGHGMPRIFWAGDSTVQTNTAATWPQTGLGQALQLFLQPGVALHNHAVNGRSTKSFLEEGRLQPIEAQLRPGDFLFVQFGHNDQKPDAARATRPFGTYAQNLGVFAQAANTKGAQPVFITPLARRRFGPNGAPGPCTHGEYPAAMRLTAAKLGVPCADLTAASRRLLAESGARATRAWYMHLAPGACPGYPDGMADDTHLHYTGALVYAALLAHLLRGISPQLGRLFDQACLRPYRAAWAGVD